MDISFVMSSHGEIASSFHQLSVGSWLMTAYNLGYATALPIVSFQLILNLKAYMGWLVLIRVRNSCQSMEG